ncbi:BA75_04127T0 [Komagataella pastoris]|uniref:BA75_04127T0 n=1 Tax=Komagataella pastoris TaxID=4922 RepID=A0A1B2JEW9_PICPA|nr:BA75_04127T0 [Komagataella pastoris]
MRNLGIALICLGMVGALAHDDSRDNPTLPKSITSQQVQMDLQRLEQLTDEQLDQLMEYFSISPASSPGFGYVGGEDITASLDNEQLQSTVSASSSDIGVDNPEAIAPDDNDPAKRATNIEDSIDNLGFPFPWKKKKKDDDDCDDDDEGDEGDTSSPDAEGSRNKVIIVTFGQDDNATLERIQQFQSQNAENSPDQEGSPNKKVFHFKEGTVIPLTPEDGLQLEALINLHHGNASANPPSFDQYSNGAKPRRGGIRNGFGIRKLGPQYSNAGNKQRVSVSAVGATVLVMYSVLFV